MVGRGVGELLLNVGLSVGCVLGDADWATDGLLVGLRVGGERVVGSSVGSDVSAMLSSVAGLVNPSSVGTVSSEVVGSLLGTLLG